MLDALRSIPDNFRKSALGMAQILFIQNLPYEYPGTGSIAALLKSRGHKVKVAIASTYRQVKSFLRPGQIVGFSVMTGMQNWAVSLSRQIKKDFNVFIVMGGPHPTYYPQVIEEMDIDAICRGEGEFAMLDLALAIDRQTDVSGIANLWVKKQAQVYKNEPRPLCGNLDELPRQDRQIYYEQYPFLRDNPHKSFIAGRGCPFDCAFCFNRQLRRIYDKKGDFVRMRSPRDVIAEIEEVRDNYGLKKVFFHDDTFILNFQWLEDF